MKTADTDILIVPGAPEMEAGHWQARWAERLRTARSLPPSRESVVTPDGNAPWQARIGEAVAGVQRPVILIAHGWGTLAAAAAAPLFAPGVVRGAFFVAPPDHPEAPEARLPFPGLLVASRTDPNCPYLRAQAYAAAWGLGLVDAGDAGGLDAASGHGPWPEGLMRLAGFLKTL